MKKRFYASIVFVFILLQFSCKESQKDISNEINLTGNWHRSTKSETSEFGLTFTQQNGKLVGEHCSIMRSGNRIDCVDVDNDGSDDRKTIHGKWDGNKWIIDFMSTYCEKNGKAIIIIENKNKIIWRIVEEPNGEYYIPNEAIMIRGK